MILEPWRIVAVCLLLALYGAIVGTEMYKARYFQDWFNEEQQ